MSGNGGRTGAAYQRLCATLRAQRPPCAICGKDIDYQAPPRTSRSFSLNHKIPLNAGGSLLDPNNAEPAHLGCNSSLGDTAPVVDGTSRTW